MEKENNFSVIHLAGALLVVLGHQYVLMGCAAPFILGVDINGLGVRIIFVMSGYLITESWLRSKGVKQYLSKRFMRIYPPLAVCVVLTVVVIGPVFTRCSLKEYWPGALDYLIKNMVLYPKFDLPGVFQDNPNQAVNGSLWTLPVEVACYLGLTVMMKCYEMLYRKKVHAANFFYLAIGAVFWCIYVLRIREGNRQSFVLWGTDWCNALELAVYFLWGSIFARLGLRRICNLQAGIVLCLIYACVPDTLREVMLLPVITYMTISFAFPDRPVFSRTIKNNKSYGIYLWAFPVQQAVIQVIAIRGQRYLQPVAMFLIAMIFIWVMAYLSNTLVEKPLLKMARGRKDSG